MSTHLWTGLLKICTANEKRKDTVKFASSSLRKNVWPILPKKQKIYGLRRTRKYHTWVIPGAWSAKKRKRHTHFYEKLMRRSRNFGKKCNNLGPKGTFSYNLCNLCARIQNFLRFILNFYLRESNIGAVHQKPKKEKTSSQKSTKTKTSKKKVEEEELSQLSQATESPETVKVTYFHWKIPAIYICLLSVKKCVVLGNRSFLGVKISSRNPLIFGRGFEFSDIVRVIIGVITWQGGQKFLLSSLKFWKIENLTSENDLFQQSCTGFRFLKIV